LKNQLTIRGKDYNKLAAYVETKKNYYEFEFYHLTSNLKETSTYMQRILEHVKPERRQKELIYNPVYPLFWKRSFHLETFEHLTSILVLLLGPLLKLSGLYQRGLQNTLAIQTTEWQYIDPQLPKMFEGFRILFLSDLHLDGNPYLIKPLCAALESVKADICLFGGDYRFQMHGPFVAVIDGFRELVQHIHSTHGLYGILGNHDSWEMIRPLERLGIGMLINEAVPITIGADRIWILGLDDPHYYECADYPKANRAVPTDAFRILLVHTTGVLLKLAAEPINLYLCGHTHAGQISLPLIGPPLTHSPLKGPYIYGRWQFQNIQGYTSSGAGTSGVPVRYRTRSEIVVITLHSKAETA
jgi:uncharacterized protein